MRTRLMVSVISPGEEWEGQAVKGMGGGAVKGGAE